MKRVTISTLLIILCGIVYPETSVNSQLLSAAKNGNISDIRTYIARGADVDTADPFDGNTAMHYAAFRGDTKMVQVLLALGASRNNPNHDGLTPLHIACILGDMNFVKLMIGWGSDINTQEEFMGKTPLYSAVEGGYSDIVQLLLRYGADASIHAYYRNYSPLNIALSKKYFTIAQTLLKVGVSANTLSIHKFTPMHWAAYENNIEAAKLLLDNGAAVDAYSYHGLTPLHLAAMNGNVEMIRLLLDAGADPVARTMIVWDKIPAGSIPADVARLYEHPDIVMVLVTAKKIDKSDTEGDKKKKKQK